MEYLASTQFPTIAKCPLGEERQNCSHLRNAAIDKGKREEREAMVAMRIQPYTTRANRLMKSKTNFT